MSKKKKQCPDCNEWYADVKSHQRNMHDDDAELHRTLEVEVLENVNESGLSKLGGELGRLMRDPDPRRGSLLRSEYVKGQPNPPVMVMQFGDKNRPIWKRLIDEGGEL